MILLREEYGFRYGLCESIDQIPADATCIHHISSAVEITADEFYSLQEQGAQVVALGEDD